MYTCVYVCVMFLFQKHIVAWKHWLGGGGIVASPVTSTDGKTVFAANLRGHVLSISIV